MKLGNCFEQAQVRLQEQEHSIEEYEEKVAMLSQETYRLSELMRAKTAEIKNLKVNNNNDLEFRVTQLMVMDENRSKLDNHLRQVEDNNEELRMTLNVAENQTN